jgi:hypothetical protein
MHDSPLDVAAGQKAAWRAEVPVIGAREWTEAQKRVRDKCSKARSAAWTRQRSISYR